MINTNKLLILLVDILLLEYKKLPKLEYKYAELHCCLHNTTLR